MSSISRKIKDKKRPNGPPNQRLHVYQPTHVPQVVRDKLQKLPEYQNLPEDDLTLLAADLTNTAKLQQSYFASHDDPASPIASPHATLLAGQPPLTADDKLKVKVILNTPASASRRHLQVSRGAPGGAACGGGGTVESVLEEEYGKSITGASLQVNDLILSWGPNNLVIPHGKAIQEQPQPFPQIRQAPSLADEIQIEPQPPADEDGEVFELDPCPGNQLESCLKVVSKYNRALYYSSTGRNSQHFVREAVKELGLKNVPQALHNRFNEYLKALKEKKSEGIPDRFDDHASLDFYVKNNFLKIKKKPHDVEFLLNHYVRFHWEAKSTVRDIRRWTCPVKECLMDMLLSYIEPKQLLLNGFR